MKTYIILIADDYPENLQIIVDALKNSNLQHKIVRAVNGKILCELAEKRHPDLIITDWEMPEMDGIEAIKYLKSINATKDIPIIMCTGIMTTSENLRMALDSGAVDYIRKPIDSIELQARVYSMLKLSDSYLTIKEQNSVLANQKEEIQTQKDELLIANATKDKFFSIIAHDLRSPFNSLIGFSELLVESGSLLSETELAKMYKQIHSTSTSTFNLLENLLEWSCSQIGRIALTPNDLKITDIINECISILSSGAEKKGLKILVDVDGTDVVYADKNTLSTIIRNLLSNAIKFTNAGGYIMITSRKLDTKYQIKIKDNGVGIKPDDLTKLFSIEHNFTTPGTANEIGSGLGLILCKDLITMNKGELSVESELGKGSVFTITMPMKE